MKKAVRIILWSLVAIIFIATFVYLFYNSKKKDIIYEVVSPIVSDIEINTVLTGKIEPRDEIEIKPQISGIIAEINVEPGDKVNAGDVIARIKVIPEESQLSSAQNRVELARISLNQSKLEYDRTKTLYDKKFISREEYEKAETAWLQSKQELAAAEDALMIVREGISSVNAQESNTLVRATINGIILDVPVKVGSSVIQANTMNAGTTVATMADMSNLIFRGSVDETEVGMLRQGMVTTISIGALPDVKLPARLEYIAPKSTDNNGSNTFEVKAAITAPDSVSIRAGYSANAYITLNRAESVMTIPESVIEWVGDSTFVYVMTDSVPVQTFMRRQIMTGMSDGIKAEVRSGVEQSDRLRGYEIKQ